MIKFTPPTLLIGKPMKDLLKQLKNQVTVYLIHGEDKPLKRLEDILNSYSLAMMADNATVAAQPLFLGDLSYFSRPMLSLLLKFVEEASFPIICLASFDFQHPVLFSRFKQIIKVSDPTPYTKIFVPNLSKALVESEVALGDTYTKIQFHEWCAVNAPSLPLVLDSFNLTISKREKAYLLNILHS